MTSNINLSSESSVSQAKTKRRKCMKQKQEQRLYEKATGRISVTLTEDMMLHYAMQESKVALKGLVCELKGLDPAEVTGVWTGLF